MSMNKKRAGWAAEAIDTFQETTQTDDEDRMSDLLCDLMHYADQNDIDFERELHRARHHHNVEIEEHEDVES